MSDAPHAGFDPDNPDTWIDPPPGTEEARKPNGASTERGTLFGRLRVLQTSDLDTAGARAYLLKGLIAHSDEVGR